MKKAFLLQDRRHVAKDAETASGSGMGESRRQEEGRHSHSLSTCNISDGPLEKLSARTSDSDILA